MDIFALCGNEKKYLHFVEMIKIFAVLEMKQIFALCGNEKKIVLCGNENKYFALCGNCGNEKIFAVCGNESPLFVETFGALPSSI